jgi:hypothetical protein
MAVVAVLVYWLIAAAIGALELPRPDATPSQRYWLRFLNHFEGNLKRGADAVKIPTEDQPQ